MPDTNEFYSYNRLRDLIDYGKNENENLKKVLLLLSHNNTCNFDDWEVMDYKPRTDDNLNYKQKQDKCSCNHHICDNRFVRNKFNGNIKIVGNVCINKYYNDEAKEKLKKLIFEEKGKKRCSGCDGKRAVDKKTVEENIDQEFFYHPSCMKIKFKKCYKCEKYKDYNCKCHLLTEETIITFGKYKNKSLSELLKDVSYCGYIKDELETIGQFKLIQEYIKKI